MRVLVHISDLHFGRTDPEILLPLLEFLRAAKPDVVAVSGDLTQRARTAEYIAAREFLDAIPFRQIIVPGNHDVPLHNVFARFAHKLDKYRRYIADDLAPFFADDEIAIAGVNTARALTWKDGRINKRQLAVLREQLGRVPNERTKIVVTHHPFDLPEGASGGKVVGRSRLAMKTLAECSVDVLLAGHFHIAATGQTTKRYKMADYNALIVSSGTSTSTRSRGEPNSLNLIRIDRPNLTIDRVIWHKPEAQFQTASVEQFTQDGEKWERLPAG